jgi:hypothetical protein
VEVKNKLTDAERLEADFVAGLKERVKDEVKKEQRMTAASMTDYRKEDEGWRKLTGNSTRDLISTTQDRMFDIAYWLWETNPLANWIIEIIVSFILADGLPYEAKNPDVKKLLDDFWFDPCNRMDLYIEKHARELHIFGSLCFPVFTAQQTGKVRMGYIDPAQIDKVITDPENVKMIIGVILKGTAGNPGRRLKAILPEGGEDILSPAAQALRDSFTDGECFFFAINNVTNSPNGRSELLVVADWLDAYEQFLFDYADKWPLLNTFVWDLLVQDGDEKSIPEQIKNFTKKSGSVFGHNQKVILAPSTPDLKAIDAKEGARLFRNHILGAKGLPEDWFGGGGDVNRATAAEMDIPTMKMLSRKQSYMKYVLESIFDTVIQRALDARYLIVPEDERDYTIHTPELASKDISKFSVAIQQISTALVSAETQGWIDKETASKIFAFAISLIGYELDVTAVQDAVAKEQDTNAYKDYLTPGKPGNGGKGKNVAV